MKRTKRFRKKNKRQRINSTKSNDLIGFITLLGKRMKDNDVDGSTDMLNEFCTSMIPERTHDRCKTDTWGYDGIENKCICVIAHSSRPVRQLVYITKRDTEKTKGVPEELRYNFIRISKDTKGRMRVNKRTPQLIITTKRGFWIPLRLSLIHI